MILYHWFSFLTQIQLFFPLSAYTTVKCLTVFIRHLTISLIVLGTCHICCMWWRFLLYIPVSIRLYPLPSGYAISEIRAHTHLFLDNMLFLWVCLERFFKSAWLNSNISIFYLISFQFKEPFQFWNLAQQKVYLWCLFWCYRGWKE